jgi:hypothetical protein
VNKDVYVQCQYTRTVVLSLYICNILVRAYFAKKGCRSAFSLDDLWRNEGVPSTLSGSCIRSDGLSHLDHLAGHMGHRLETMYRITADRQFEACPGMHVGNMFMTHVSADSVGSTNRKKQGRRVESNMPSIHAFWSSAMGLGLIN